MMIDTEIPGNQHKIIKQGKQKIKIIFPCLINLFKPLSVFGYKSKLVCRCSLKKRRLN